MGAFMKILKKSWKIIEIILCVIVVSIVILAIYNQIALKQEKSKIVPNGQLIDVGGYRIHVYSEGENENAPTLVFLSGSATVAPVYDFKPLYSLISDEYRIAVVEKPGYGYSEMIDLDRDVGTMVDEVRSGLKGADINAPYILVPHSMSGLEAIYWAQNHPDEVAGIVGLDMAVPSSYDDFDFNKVKTMSTWGSISAKLGLLRIPGIYPINTSVLNENEIEQQKFLMYKNAVNQVYINEGNFVYENAQAVKAGGKIACPIIMFSSNGTEIGDFWIGTQKQFANENNADLIFYDCGHYLHYYKSDEMADRIKAFVNGIQ